MIGNILVWFCRTTKLCPDRKAARVTEVEFGLNPSGEPYFSKHIMLKINKWGFSKLSIAPQSSLNWHQKPMCRTRVSGRLWTERWLPGPVLVLTLSNPSLGNTPLTATQVTFQWAESITPLKTLPSRDNPRVCTVDLTYSFPLASIHLPFSFVPNFSLGNPFTQLYLCLI